ncbi:MAG: hypothetical protein HY556_05875 [Euryarchaeota archaeon]|nr:hypothetical protein [Euryarchaeota archaeon]
MPTSKNSDLVCVPVKIKALMKTIKGPLTYGELISALLRETDVAAFQSRLKEELAMTADRATMLQTSPSAEGSGPRRTASKQLLIAELAGRAWTTWVDAGRVTRLGPRRYRWNLRPSVMKSGVTIVRRPGRGLPSR